MASLGLSSAQGEARGLATNVAGWWYDDNNDRHHTRPGRLAWESGGLYLTELDGSLDLSEGQEQQTLALPSKAKSAIWENATTISSVIDKDPSPGYFTFRSTVVVPLPKRFLNGSDLEVTFGLRVSADATWVNGTYSKPEGIVLVLNGFNETYRKEISAPYRKKTGPWLLDVYLAARTAISEAIPLPHVTLEFTTEVVGTYGSATVDFDVVAMAVWSVSATRLVLRRLHASRRQSSGDETDFEQI